MASRLQYYQWSIFATLFVGYATFAYNRKSVSLAMPQLIASGLDKSDAGLIISSQNVAYAISKFIGGVLSDRLSSRLLFSSGLFLSGIATLLFSSSDSVLVFTLLWFMNGFAQGFGWPSCAKVLRQWYSPQQFGTFWSLLSASSNVSGTVSPFFAAYIIINYGWRASLLIAGTFSLLIASISIITVVNKPQDVNLLAINSESVKKDKNEKKPKKSEDDNSAATFAHVISSPFLWLVSFSYMSVFAAKTSAIDWGQLYLIEDRKQSHIVGSAFTSSVEFGGFFGGVIAGYLTDIMVRRVSTKSQSPSNARMPVAIAMMTGVALTLHALYFNITSESSQLFISSLAFVLGACLYGPIAIFGVVATESAPQHLSGTSHAIVALAANVGAIISGLPFSLLAKHFGWSAIFLLLEVTSFFTIFVMILFRNIPAKIAKLKQS